MKTKEQIKQYNKEYFARPEVIARAKIRNSQPHIKQRRKQYKKTENGRRAENRYRNKRYSEVGSEKHLLVRYKITLDDYNNMLLKQNSVCAICCVYKNEKLHVDHCHITGTIRGLLCGSCNRALGLLKDDVERLSKAIEYLKK